MLRGKVTRSPSIPRKLKQIIKDRNKVQIAARTLTDTSDEWTDVQKTSGNTQDWSDVEECTEEVSDFTSEDDYSPVEQLRCEEFTSFDYLPDQIVIPSSKSLLDFDSDDFEYFRNANPVASSTQLFPEATLFEYEIDDVDYFKLNNPKASSTLRFPEAPVAEKEMEMMCQLKPMTGCRSVDLFSNATAVSLPVATYFETDIEYTPPKNINYPEDKDNTYSMDPNIVPLSHISLSTPKISTELEGGSILKLGVQASKECSILNVGSQSLRNYNGSLIKDGLEEISFRREGSLEDISSMTFSLFNGIQRSEHTLRNIKRKSAITISNLDDTKFNRLKDISNKDPTRISILTRSDESDIDHSLLQNNNYPDDKESNYSMDAIVPLNNFSLNISKTSKILTKPEDDSIPKINVLASKEQGGISNVVSQSSCNYNGSLIRGSLEEICSRREDSREEICSRREDSLEEICSRREDSLEQIFSRREDSLGEISSRTYSFLDSIQRSKHILRNIKRKSAITISNLDDTKFNRLKDISNKDPRRKSISTNTSKIFPDLEDDSIRKMNVLASKEECSISNVCSRSSENVNYSVIEDIPEEYGSRKNSFLKSLRKSKQKLNNIQRKDTVINSNLDKKFKRLKDISNQRLQLPDKTSIAARNDSVVETENQEHVLPSSKKKYKVSKDVPFCCISSKHGIRRPLKLLKPIYRSDVPIDVLCNIEKGK